MAWPSGAAEALSQRARRARGSIASARSRSIFAVSAGAVAAGILGGACAVAFRAVVNLVTHAFFFHELGTTFRSPADHLLGWQVIGIPIAGAALIVVLARLLPGEAEGGGTTEVIEAASLRGGHIPAWRTIKGVLLAGLSLGTGGSSGREGPIVQLGGLSGAAIGASPWFGRRERRVLVACGATAALAATFNAPIAAVVFGMEVILLEFRTLSFVPLVIASVAGTSIGRVLLGNKPTFVLPPGFFVLGSQWELVLYAILGLVAGVAGILFLSLYEAAERWREPSWFPAVLVPIAGGLALGLLGLMQPRLFGVGYETVNAIFNGQLGTDAGQLAAFFVVVLLLKPLAVTITLRSGGTGGVFSPTLFEGAIVGALFGLGVAEILPGIHADPAAFALVGMAAVFAAVTRATLTAIVLVVELTLSFDVVLPVMLACVLADLVAWTRHPGSLYSAKLAAKGRPVPLEMEPNVLDLVLVSEVMDRKVEALAASATLRDYAERSMSTGRHAFPLVDKAGKLTGVVTRSDLRAKSEGLPADRPIAAIASRDCFVAYPDETVHMAIDTMVGHDIGHLPVVSRDDPQALVGWLTRADALAVEKLRLDSLLGFGDSSRKG